ncbi:crAss001_48 related protein [Paraburkholderia tropica]|uniref:crAss001_48 related protein n=1 Tax=Paraburkholderia tropica TaxID=92647 RepID=UPI003D28CA39
MAKFEKKPVVVEAITFEELVAHGRTEYAARGDALPVDMLPWSFAYGGHPITHEDDDCYLIPTRLGTMRFERGDMLITGVKGEIYPCKADIFAMTYERDLAPHQVRVVAEKNELDEKIAKLVSFVGSPTWSRLDEAERSRLTEQGLAMQDYSRILGDRIAAFGGA